MKIKFSRRFAKQYRKANPKIKSAFEKRLKLFLKNPHDPLLYNHPLKGRLKGYRSINVTGDWRAIFSQSKNRNLATFEMIGTHGQLYK